MADERNLLDLLGDAAPRERLRAAIDADIRATRMRRRGLAAAAAVVLALGLGVLFGTLRGRPAPTPATEAADTFDRLDVAASLLGRTQHTAADVERLAAWVADDASVNVRLLSVDALASSPEGREALSSVDLGDAPPILVQHLQASLARWGGP